MSWCTGKEATFCPCRVLSGSGFRVKYLEKCPYRMFFSFLLHSHRIFTSFLTEIDRGSLCVILLGYIVARTRRLLKLHATFFDVDPKVIHFAFECV